MENKKKLIFKHPRQRGFTLIELLVVVVVIGIIITLGISNVSSIMAKSRDTQRKGDLKAVSDAISLYYQENNNQYPTASGFASLVDTLKNNGNLEKKNVQDPLNKGNYIYKYGYANDDQGATLSYCITAVLEDTAKDKSDDTDGGPNVAVYEVLNGKEANNACNAARP